GIKAEVTVAEKLRDLKSRDVSDTVRAMARRSEPRAFGMTGSSVIGLLIDENNHVEYHSRIDVADTTANLDALQPRLFPDMAVVERSPFRVMAEIRPRPRGNVQVVAVFMKKPAYAPDSR
ncbi:MAG: hypothetical protein ACRD3J_04840, partial [Thermoanaerobaculia bacterium]